MIPTEEQIAEIRARADAATPGPWKWWTSNSWNRLKRDDLGVTQNVAEPFVNQYDRHPDLSINKADMNFIAHARTDIPALLSALEAAQSANRPRDDYQVFCSDCGRAHVLDTVLPSEIWNKIASPDDLLCVVCIDTRLKKAGLTAEAEFYYSGDALRSRLYGDADALEACGTTEAIEAVAASLSGTPSPIPGDTTK